jgi:site-specific DNA recombinase
VEAVLATYADRRWLARPSPEHAATPRTECPGSTRELLSVDAEIAKAQRALDRYFVAFEDGTLSSKRLADRIDGLERRLHELRSRKEELHEVVEGQRYAGPSEADLGDIIEAVREAIEQGTRAGAAASRSTWDASSMIR